MAAATPAATASWPMPRWVVPRTRPSKNSSWARTSNCRHSTIVRYIRRRVSRSMPGALVAMPLLVGVGDEQLVGWETGDDPGTVGGDHDLFLDPRGGHAVLRRAVRLEGDDHALLELDRVLERVEPADDRALVEHHALAVTELEAEALHLVVEPEVLGLRPHARDLVGRDTGSHELDRLVDPLAGPLVGVALGVVRGADDERPVVARLVADERLDDVEEGLVARPDDPVGEDVRVRAAALARHGVDVVDVLRSKVEQELRDV